jgi:cytochrome P450
MAITQRIEDLDDPTFDPHFMDLLQFGDEFDPYARLHRLRAEAAVQVVVPDDGPASYVDSSYLQDRFDGHFMVLSHGAVEQVLDDPITFSNRPLLYNLGISFGRSLTVMDPPEHTKYRKILQRAFRPQTVQAWGNDIVGPVIEELISAFRFDGRAELEGQFCRPYPFNVIYRMLDLPPDDIDVFYKLTMAQIAFVNDMALPVEAGEKLGRYFRAMIDDRRANPGNDVVSVIATAEVDGEYLPDEEAISFLRQLINAGGDTTYRTTTALLTGLFTNPDQLEAVRADRSLVASAVEEALRWDGPVIANVRSTTCDTELEGVRIPANSLVTVSFGGANRDPDVFERPDEFDIFRERHRHFGFAHGAHNCLGQVLARLEMTRALNAILDELPNVRVDPDRAAPQMRGAGMRTPGELHVVFDPH